MVIWASVEASCPVCAQRLRLRLVGSGFASGQDSDLLVRMAGRHIIQVEIHTCGRCRYSGYAPDFLRDLPPLFGERFLANISPLLVEREVGGEAESIEGAEGNVPAPPPGRTPLPDVQYYWAFKAAEALGTSAQLQGELLLRAYWCLRLPPSSSLPPETRELRRRTYLRGAVQKLRQDIAAARDPNRIYLVAELCRRKGNFRLAVGYFRRFLEETEGARYLKQAAVKLLAAARDRTSREMTMEEILFDGAPDSASRGSADGA